MNDFAAMNAVYARYFEGDRSARACVQVSRLPKDVLVEIDCIAVIAIKLPLSSTLSIYRNDRTKIVYLLFRCTCFGTPIFWASTFNLT